MPMTTVPPQPWKLTIDIFDAFDSAVRSEDLAAAREVLEKNRELTESTDQSAP